MTQIKAISIRTEGIIKEYKTNWDTKHLHKVVSLFKKLTTKDIKISLFTLEPIHALMNMLEVLNLTNLNTFHIYGNGEGIYNPFLDKTYLISENHEQIHFFNDVCNQLLETIITFGGIPEYKSNLMMAIILPPEQKISEQNFIQIILNKLKEESIFINEECLSGDLSLEMRYYKKHTIMFITLPFITDETSFSLWSNAEELPLDQIAMIASDDTEEFLLPQVQYTLTTINNTDIQSKILEIGGFISDKPYMEGLVECLEQINTKINDN